MKNMRQKSGILGFCAVVLLVSASFPAAAHAALPAGFEVEKVVGGLNLPSAMQFTTDGRIFIAEKAGAVRVVKNGVLLPTPVIQLTDVNSYGDRGLIGMVLDPNFNQNGYIYLLYTYENTPGANIAGTKTARIVRITVTGDLSDESTKFVVLGSVGGTSATPSCENYAVTSDCIPSDSPSHSGGALRFGPDGKLYVTLGDGAHFDYVDARAQRAQNLDSLGGKVLRINTDGTGVADNPFYTGNPNDNRSKVYAYGMRNAFRMNFRPGTNALYAGDVGWSSWEEVDKIVPGGNYGWPCREGDTQTTGYNCDVTPRVDPLYTYAHDVNGAGAVVAGAFPTAYPAAYNNSFFIGDYAQNWIKRVVVDQNDNFVSIQDFMLGADGAMGPVALDRGPDGNIYYIAIYAGELRRILYTTGNRQPIAQLSSSATNGLAPLTVNFSAAGSSDPDGNPLTYSWNFGDGATSSLVAPTHTYGANGTYTAFVTVFDGQGGQNTKSTTVTVGNRAPTAMITSPVNGSLYKVGDLISLSGQGTDPEDGTITAASQLTWTIILHHNTHIHILQTLTGPNPSFTAPDHSGATDIYTEVQLTVTDSGGLTSTKSINLYLNNNTNTSGNLLLNPSLEDAVDGAADTPQYWSRGGYGVNGAVYTYPVPGFDGAKGAKVAELSYTDGDVKWFPNPVSVSANTLYSFSGYYFSNTPAYVTAQIGDTNGVHTYLDLATLPATAGWTRVDETFTTPANATTASVAMYIASVGELTIDNFSISQGTSTPDTVAPTVAVTVPANNAVATGTITLTATATDNVAVSNVKFYLDSVFLNTNTTAPYSYIWNSKTVTDGNHSLVAVARDAAGNVATSTAVIIKVQNNTGTTSQNLISNPSVEAATGAAPTDWFQGGWGTNTSTFTYPATGFDGAKGIQVKTTAYTDGDAKWYFKDVAVTPRTQYTFSDYYQATVPTSVIAQYTLTNGTLSYVTLAATVPAAAAWTKTSYTTTAPATAKSVTIFHLLSAVGTLTTDLYSITGPGTTTQDTTPPTVALTNPTSAQVTSGTIQLSAAATDASGVAGVKFLIDGAQIGTEDTASPYTTTLDTTILANGTHTATAVARDTVGNTATTTTTTFSVQNSTGTTTGQNLIQNPSVETAAGTLPQNWSQDDWGTNTSTFTYPVAGFDGAKALKVQTTAYTDGDTKWVFADVPVTPGTQYTFSDYYQATVPTSLVAQYTSNTNTLSYAFLSTVPAATPWTKTTTTFTPPASTKSVTVFHILSAVGTLTTDAYSITGPGSTTTPPADNLIANGSLETTNGASPLGWNHAGWGTNTANYNYPVVGHDGNKAAEVQVTAYTDGDIKWAPNPIVLQHGKVYTFSSWYKATTISDVIGQYKMTDGTYHYFGVIKELQPTSTWTQFTASFTPPDTAVEFTPFHLISAVGTLDTDDVSLTITGNGTSTNDVTAPIVAITAPPANATVSGTVTVVASSTDNVGVTGVMFAVDGTPKTGLIATAPYTYSWDTTQYTDGVHTLKATTNDAAGNNSTNTITVTVNNSGTTTPPNQNLVLNPSMETANGANPANWSQDTWGTNNAVFTYPVAGTDGAKASKVQITTYTDGDAKWYFDPVTVTPGASYTFSDNYLSTVGTPIVLQYTLTDGTTSYVDLDYVPAAATWTAVQDTFTAPANAKDVTVLHILASAGSLSTDAFSLVQN